MLHFKISDSGIGVPEATREAIFEPLTKAHGESVEGGVGMGLAIAKALCEVLAGSLALEEAVIDDGEDSHKFPFKTTFHESFPITTLGEEQKSKRSSISRSLRLDSDQLLVSELEEVERDRQLTTVEDEDTAQMPSILLVEDVQLNQKLCRGC